MHSPQQDSAKWPESRLSAQAVSRILALKIGRLERQNFQIHSHAEQLLWLRGVKYGVVLKPAWIKGKHHFGDHCKNCS
jgi:hypothetical protein